MARNLPLLLVNIREQFAGIVTVQVVIIRKLLRRPPDLPPDFDSFNWYPGSLEDRSAGHAARYDSHFRRAGQTPLRNLVDLTE